MDEVGVKSNISDRLVEMPQFPQTSQDPYLSKESIRNISIEPLDSGYLVRVGCQSIAVETKEKLLLNLTSYINNPGTYEDIYFKNNKKLI
jgi:hypothetical protein